VARREIEAALAAGDADLAQSFIDLAADRDVAVDPALVQRVNAATAEAATTRHKVKSFARGLVSGEPDDMAALAGTAVGDLFVFGDIRDAVREGTRLARGQAADELVLGLASAGIAITAATYVTFGTAASLSAVSGASYVRRVCQSQRRRRVSDARRSRSSASAADCWTSHAMSGGFRKPPEVELHLMA
jgi:hypothetical protein